MQNSWVYAKIVLFLQADIHRPELLPIPPSELPFKCHLCDSSFGERNDALEHIRCQHPNEFQLLVSKGALETNTDEEKHQPDDNDEILDSNRGRFPDYANRKVGSLNLMSECEQPVGRRTWV